ncbi:MAG: 2-dehydro-3-deoxygluconokinase, partial [Candidatus Aminicenantes bacterium RBG_13_63_10]
MPALTVAAFGEIMLRLSPPGRERLFQSPQLQASFGGGEANVLVSLAAFGHKTRFLSLVPENAVGNAAVAELRRRGVGTDFILRRGGRLGIYFAEPGSSQRPSRVIYDREHSSLAEARPGDIDWDRALSGIDWFHVTGITPALGAAAAALTLEALRASRAAGIKVSLDLNHRSTLWRYGKSAPEVMDGLAALADVLMANEEDCQKSLGLSLGSVQTADGMDIPSAEKMTGLVMSRFPQLKAMTMTLRRSFSADRNGWSAVLRTRDGFWTGSTYDISTVVDRIG